MLGEIHPCVYFIIYLILKTGWTSVPMGLFRVLIEELKVDMKSASF